MSNAAEPLPDTLGTVVQAASARLKAAGIDNPRLDARLIVAHALGCQVEDALIHPERAVDAAACNRIAAMLERRIMREPVSHILGQREFWSMPFLVSADTLTPRPDTEILIEAVLAKLNAEQREQPLSILDLGVGSGCIILSLLSELPSAMGLGIDASEAALDVAKSNAKALDLSARVKFSTGNWTRGLDGPFDIVVSNPPYIPAGDIDALEPEVATYEPRLALDGGEDGLEAYRDIACDLGRILAPGGMAGFEVGIHQAEDVAVILRECGFDAVEIHQDLGGVSRVVLVRISDE